MSNTYFSGDFHFGDQRMKILQRPFSNEREMRHRIIDRWNEIVLPEDTVWFLGDVCYYSNPEYIIHVHEMNGIKHMIRGNHDQEDDDHYLRYFESIHNSYDLPATDILPELHLDHYPSRAIPEKFNICGHIHGQWRIQKNTINVGVDAWHFTPVPEEELAFVINAIENYYDDDVWVANLHANSAHEYRGKKGSYTEKYR